MLQGTCKEFSFFSDYISDLLALTVKKRTLNETFNTAGNAISWFKCNFNLSIKSDTNNKLLQI